MPKKKLTPKQERFAEEYLVDLNATQAAIRAGYSVKTADQQGHQLLKNTKVAEAVQKARAKLSKNTGITQERVIAELAKIGFSDLRRVMTNQGGLIDVQDWDEEVAGAVSSVEVVRRQSGEYDEDGNPIMDHVHKIKTWDKVAALEKIGRHLGMFPNKHEHTGADGKPLRIVTTEMTPQEAAEAYGDTINGNEG